MKFNRKLLGFCLLNMLGSVYAATDKPVLNEPMPVEAINYPAMEAWGGAFRVHLLRHSDPEVQVYGLLQLITADRFLELNPEVFREMQRVVKKISEPVTLSLSAHIILLNVCTNPKITEICDHNQLMARMIEQHPDDISAYMWPLFESMRQDNEGESIDWVRHMSSASQNSFLLHYGGAFESALMAYVAENPFSVAVLEESVTDHLYWFHREDELTDDELQAIRLQSPKDYLLMIKISADIQIPSLPLRGLMDACSQFNELANDCLIIAEKMIHSEDYLNIMVGLGVAGRVYEALGDGKNQQLMAQKKSRLDDEIKCLGELVNASDVFHENTADMLERIAVARAQGDRAGMIHQANRLYERAKNVGTVDAEAQNPAVCLEQAS